MTQPQQWTGVGRTETGYVRASNQDALAVLNDCGVWIVADGMGGHPAGDIAAQTAVAMATERARERAAWLREHPSAAFHTARAKALCLRAQHEMWKIVVPWMRRHVRTLRHVAHVAEITVLDDVPIRLFRHVVDFAAGRRIDGVEQGRKGIAETEAAATAVADVEDARELFVERRGVGELRRAPVDRMTRWGLEAAFAARSWRIAHCVALDANSGPGHCMARARAAERWLTVSA